MNMQNQYSMNQPFTYDLIVTFVQASGVAVGDVGGSSDPYIIAKLNDISWRTHTLLNTLNPVWNEQWWISNCPLGARFDIGIWDYDFMKRDDIIGTLSFNFNGELGETQKVLDVIYRRAPHGTLTIQIFAQPSHTPGGPLRTTGPIKFEKHTSYMAGALTQHTEEASLAYSVYKIHLPYVAACFHNKTQKWNTKYKQARMIFTQMPQGIVARKIIHSLHESLYRPTGTSKYGTLSSGLSFLQLFQFGQRGGQTRFFTYVISENTLKFSETGAPFFTDFMSKHAMHSNCAKEVYYSGEFCVAQTSQGWKFYIDNNSGTYAPDKADLPCLEACILQNFPDLDVAAVDREDPRLADLKRKNPTNTTSQQSSSNPMQAYQQYFNPNTMNGNPSSSSLADGSSFPLQNPAQLHQLQSQQLPPSAQYPPSMPHHIVFNSHSPSPSPTNYSAPSPPPPYNQSYNPSPPYSPNGSSQQYQINQFNSNQYDNSQNFQNSQNQNAQNYNQNQYSQHGKFQWNNNYFQSENDQDTQQNQQNQQNQNQQSIPASVATRPSKLLQPGETFPLDVPLLRIGFGWEIIQPYESSQAPVELDGTTFSLRSDGKIATSTDMTFYNNQQSTDGSIYNHGGNITSAYEGDLEQVSIDLGRISPDTVSVVFVLAVYDAEQRGMNFGYVRNPFIRVSDTKSDIEICRFYFSQDGRPHSAVIMGKLIMGTNKWFFQAVGEGMAGIKSVANLFGVITA